MTKKILIVEDNADLANVLLKYLGDAGFDCHHIGDGALVEVWVRDNSPNMILLDVELPGVDGLELCQLIRVFSSVPIIMVTGRAAEVDQLDALNNGADDYICKPFRPREVVARVQAIFRRVAEHYGVDIVQSKANDDLFVLDVKRHRLKALGHEIYLTSVQCNLLALLMNNEGSVLSREDLMESIYPDNRIVSNRTIDSHIRELRKHISTALPDQEVIFSIYGAGYKFESPVF